MQKPGSDSLSMVYSKAENALTGGNPLVDLGGFHRYVFDYISDFRLMENRCMLLIINGRGERIRTSDPLVPNQIQPHIETC